MRRVRFADLAPWRWRLFGPILPYDLLTSSRRARWYLLRIAMTGVMFAVFWKAWTRVDDLASLSGSRQTARALLAQNFYSTFAWLHMTAALLLANAFLGGAIADERRRRLLEFMFATDLTNREIILGKFASRTYMIATLLGGSLPVLACTMLFGGVPVDWIAQLALLTVSTLICYGGLSVLVSTTIARPRDAVVRAIFLTVFFVAVPPVVQLIAPLFQADVAYYAAWACDYASLLNPYVVLWKQTSGPLKGAEWYVWDSTLETAAVQTAVGLLTLLWAVLTVRRIVANPPSESAAKKPPPLQRSFFRPELGNWSPVLWREAFGEPAVKSRGPAGRFITRLFFLLVNVGIVALWLYTTNESFYGTPQVLYSMTPIAVIVAILFLVMVGTRAAGTVTSEREGDTWTTLVAGPIPAESIVAGKVWGSLLSFRRLLVPFLLVWFLVGVSFLSRMPNATPFEALLRGGVMMAVAVLLGFVNANIGLFFSMRSKSTSAAVVKTVLTILFLGGGYLLPFALMATDFGNGVMSASQFFLVAVPGFLNPSESGRENGEAAMMFVVGCMMYVIFGAGLYAFNWGAFDRRAGRTSAAPRRTAPLRTAGEAHPATERSGA